MVLLVVVLLVPGTPQAGERYQALLMGSGAFADFPLNRTFDAEPMVFGTAPTNYDLAAGGFTNRPLSESRNAARVRHRNG